MIATEVGICNSALSKIGGKLISSLVESTKNANLCNEQYPKARDALLREHAWNFAVKLQKLGRLAEAPTFGFQYKYQLPSDWLRTLEVYDNDEAHGTTLYRIEGQTIHTDAEDLYLRYIARIEDPNTMTADFREVLAFYLARELAIPIANSNTLFQLMEVKYESKYRKARSTDAIEDFPEQLPEGSWSSARNRGSRTSTRAWFD